MSPDTIDSSSVMLQWTEPSDTLTRRETRKKAQRAERSKRAAGKGEEGGEEGTTTKKKQNPIR